MATDVTANTYRSKGDRDNRDCQLVAVMPGSALVFGGIFAAKYKRFAGLLGAGLKQKWYQGRSSRTASPLLNLFG
jgi:hypothetical protein